MVDLSTPDHEHPPAETGIVVIGRNEGQRLVRCLNSIRELASSTVYVDSGSTDQSVEASRRAGTQVVELDTSIPFTAARARNVGFDALLSSRPELKFVFFVDGDCEVASGWLATAVEYLKANRDFAVAWGRRRERFPEKSIYNMLCDIEWDIPPGESKICGGDAVVRVEAFRAVHGYRADLICGEEPELCVRLRQARWRIAHLADEMTLHDAAMYRFGQWWMRSKRAGYAYALGASLHGGKSERHWVAESRRALLWGLILPAIFLGAVGVYGPAAFFLFLIYGLQWIRLAMNGPRKGSQNLWWAAAMVAGKFPEAVGQIKFYRDRLTGSASKLIEYK